MDIPEMKQAIESAKIQINRSDQVVSDMADLIVGRLGNGRVKHTTLVKLKRELANYNMHTGRWKKG